MSRSRRFAILAGLAISAACDVAMGLGLGVAAGIGGAVLVLSYVAFLEFGRGDRARTLAGHRERSDERQVAISNEAALAGYLAVVAGDTRRGRPFGPNDCRVWPRSLASARWAAS